MIGPGSDKNANVRSVEQARVNNLYRHQWSVVAYAKVMTLWFPLVPVTLIKRFVDLKLQKKIKVAPKRGSS